MIPSIAGGRRMIGIMQALEEHVLTQAGAVEVTAITVLSIIGIPGVISLISILQIATTL
jgi:hypothetical protein